MYFSQLVSSSATGLNSESCRLLACLVVTTCGLYWSPCAELGDRRVACAGSVVFGLPTGVLVPDEGVSSFALGGHSADLRSLFYNYGMSDILPISVNRQTDTLRSKAGLMSHRRVLRHLSALRFRRTSAHNASAALCSPALALCALLPCQKDMASTEGTSRWTQVNVRWVPRSKSVPWNRQSAFVILLVPRYIRVSLRSALPRCRSVCCWFLLRSHAAVDGSFSCALILLRIFFLLRADSSMWRVLECAARRYGDECDEKSQNISRNDSLQSLS